mmetsp:Transcript_61671/g.198686  ORF Transcript_61671/g.198686 Transcript_61671/m.198686 type:complete len:158 (-) Transcript_61671:584-1057(-)
MGGLPGSKLVQDSLAAVSPWTTHVRVENKTGTPVLILLARSSSEPRPDDAVEHHVPANSTYAISSGWLNEPRATLLVRTSSSSASIVRVPHSGRVVMSLAPHGLAVESPDRVVIEDFQDASSVPGLDTVPMVLRGESFVKSAAESLTEPEAGGSTGC